MKMKAETYAALLGDVKEIIAAVEETGSQPLPTSSVDPDALTVRDMWDVHQKALIDRGNADHPWFSRAGVLGRVLPFTDRSPYFLYNDEGLDDSHVETAFRRMMGEIAEERAARAAPAV